MAHESLLSFSVWPLLPTHCRCRGLLYLITMSDTYTVWLSGREIGPLQRPLPDNIQYSQETDIHAPGGIRTRNLSKPAADALYRAVIGIGSLEVTQRKIMRGRTKLFYSSIQYSSGSLRNHHDRICQRSVQRQMDCTWTAAFTACSGLAAQKSGSVILWDCAMGKYSHRMLPFAIQVRWRN